MILCILQNRLCISPVNLFVYCVCVGFVSWLQSNTHTVRDTDWQASRDKLESDGYQDAEKHDVSLEEEEEPTSELVGTQGSEASQEERKGLLSTA